MKIFRVAFVFLPLASACENAPALDPDLPPARYEAQALARVAQLGRIADWDRDLVVQCDDSAAVEGELPDCHALVMQADGATRPLLAAPVLRAKRLPGERSVVLTRGLELQVVAASGAVQTVRTGVAELALDPAGRRLAFVELPAGATTLEAGVDARIVVQDRIGGDDVEIAHDPIDSQPYPVPDSDDVLFVSGRSGVASFWIGDGHDVRQLTNLGLDRADTASFVPVPSGQLVWWPERKVAVYAARYATDEIWALDVDKATAWKVGAGRSPAIGLDGEILALVDATDGARVASYASPEVR